jgi:hypothetical protein
VGLVEKVGTLEPINVIAGLTLCQLSAYLAWLGSSGGWPGAMS